MKIIRYLDRKGELGFGRIDDEGLMFVIRQNEKGGFAATDDPADPGKILSPVDFRCIYCVGLNYKAHAEESGEKPPKHPMIFMKAATAIQDPGSPIVLPRFLRSDMVDYEGELGVVIGRPCKNVTKEEALDYVLGYVCANDVSARDWQKEKGGGQYCRGKTFDTFCPVGPCLVTTDEIPDPSKLTLRTYLNDDVVQESGTDDLIFDVPTLIAFLSGSTTLLPGTLILTGTPSGVGSAQDPRRFLMSGDEVTVEIEGIGKLTNFVVEEALTDEDYEKEKS
ncbi:MAG: fumarylacetoacetate hydrolase family protein [Verrucomicrobia bacterium]|nr:fumarylacetoacetate hydrolase family protein [Verrucomicrobiota bacterium]MDA1048237.1 fumarylacetoacetate hydrolase family protein [Verrucomicrobiota bacterium]